MILLCENRPLFQEGNVRKRQFNIYDMVKNINRVKETFFDKKHVVVMTG